MDQNNTTDLNDERRTFDRFEARYPAKMKDGRDDFGSTLTLRNASAQGARFASNEKMFIDDSLSVEINLPDGKNPLSLKGQVVWVKDNEGNSCDFGLKFHKVDFVNLSRLYTISDPNLHHSN